MMDNKLSELSKPVAQIYYDEHDSSVMRIGWLRSDEPKNPEPLYSQEYVSALLAELEFEKQNNAGVAGMVEDYETKLEAKDKRVAELEAQAKVWESAALKHLARAEEAEKRLDTPVRLPETCAFNLCDLVDRDAVIASLREQGFTVSEE